MIAVFEQSVVAENVCRPIKDYLFIALDFVSFFMT